MIKKTFLLAASILLALLIAEGFLELVKPHQFYMRQPSRKIALHPDKRYIRGIEGPSMFTINRLGLRGDELANQEIKILTVGGSATECAYLDDGETWPHLLQDYLAEKTGKSVWVGNAGVSGHYTRHHVLEVEKLLDQISRIDLVILLIGANDAGNSADPNYNSAGLDNPNVKDHFMRTSFEIAPIPIHRLKDLQLYKKMVNIYDYFSFDSGSRKFDKRKNGGWYGEKRKLRESSQIVSLTDDLWNTVKLGLTEYRINIEKITDLCHRHGVEVLFLTQPALFNKDKMTAEEELLMRGGMIPQADPKAPLLFLNNGDRRKVLKLFNKDLIENTGDYHRFDLDPIISSQSDSFYDDLHFTEIGAKRIAESVTEDICQEKIFSCGN